MAASVGEEVFGKKNDSFESAFPEIEVRVEETDLVETQKTRHYTIDTVPGKEPCSNSNVRIEESESIAL